MDLDSLEYHKVLNIIKNYCFSDYGKEHLDNLRPTINPEEELLKVKEMMEGLQYDGEPPLGGIFYLRDQFKKVKQGFLPNPSELLKFREFFIAIKNLKRFYSNLKEKYPRIWALLSDLEEVPTFCSEVTRCIDEDGNIKDSASQTLKEIRIEIKKTVSHIKTLVERLVRKYKDSLQDPPYIQRNGRYVFLVKSSRRKDVRGILISASSSGMTIYVEPEEILQLNDKLKQLEIDEKNEERRIIRNISQILIDKEKRIFYTLDQISYFDSLYARARYGIKKKAIVPKINREGVIKLINARHPLIAEEKVVPISLEIEKGKLGVVLTGPNTGGKTVALKTVGLFVLMMMSGIPILCDEGSTLSVFDEIKADIGDEQSIEQSLSTFSAHMVKIIDMLKIANEKTLLLIDEIGAGTDPIEGAALAIAIISYLLDKGARIMVTTHLTPLKLYAFEDSRLTNAAVEFDIKTLKPTYRIMMGIAGSSQALEIAKRLGIPEEVLELSKKYMDERLRNVDNVIQKLQTEKIKLEKERQELKKLWKITEIKSKTLEKEIQKLKTKKTHKLLEEIDELERQLKQVKKTLEEAVAEARKTKNLGELEKLNRKVQKINPKIIKDLREKLVGSEASNDVKFNEGDIVRIFGTASVGKIVLLDGKKAVVNINGIKFETTVDKLEKVQIETTKDVINSEITKVDKSDGTLEIDIRGMTVEEAEDVVRRFIDNLILNNFGKGYIIHGKGTLRLARGIREILQKEPRVKRFNFAPPEEGGTGVTIVEVK